VIWLLGLWVTVGSAYLLTAWAALRAAFSRRLLVGKSDDRLGAQIAELTRSRARIVDAHEAERRRMERDLHDGVQQRLTALIMTIGLAGLEVSDGPPPARELVAKAHDEAKQTLAELRDLVHGIHPSVLTDRGLEAAVVAVAERSPIPVELELDLPSRLPDATESAAYFVVCEALANVAKHSRARHAGVGAWQAGDALTVEVRDDGVGGASPGAGGGLNGLADRVAALGGIVQLSSPPGGPSVLRVRIPCVS
jgi:signal transduction histidine kinase